MIADLRSPLATHIQAFIAHKRALGKGLHKQELVFRRLDRYLVEHGVASPYGITPAILDGFLCSRPRLSPRSYNELLGSLRRLFDWLVWQEVFAASPLSTPSRRVPPRRRPFLFNSDQAKQLFDAAGRLPSYSRSQNRGEIYRMIFLLLYGLGLRVGEVSRLHRDDVDLDRGLLLICQTKFGKSRWVPFGPNLTREITRFLQRRDERLDNIPPDFPIFSFAADCHRPIRPNNISQTFHNLLPSLDLIVPVGTAPPHLHCLRHSFAVNTLLRWYRSGLDPAARLLDLATFLGHVSPSSTAVYLTITAELLECANERFARFASPVIKELLS